MMEISKKIAQHKFRLIFNWGGRLTERLINRDNRGGVLFRVRKAGSSPTSKHRNVPRLGYVTRVTYRNARKISSDRLLGDARDMWGRFFCEDAFDRRHRWCLRYSSFICLSTTWDVYSNYIVLSNYIVFLLFYDKFEVLYLR